MSAWINLILDVVLIGLVTAGLVQATRLIQHLSGLREGRVEMERFVREFNGVVIRAEAGIKNLRQAARDSGNDLEKMVDKATLMRDELQFIVESADRIAGRLTQEAGAPSRPSAEAAGTGACRNGDAISAQKGARNAFRQPGFSRRTRIDAGAGKVGLR